MYGSYHISCISNKLRQEKIKRDFQMEQKGHGVVLFPAPFQGHINPMLQLANILHAKGISITIIQTQFNSTNPSNYPHFRFCFIPYGLSDNEVPSDINDIIVHIRAINTSCVTPFRDCLSELLSSKDGDHIVCLISDGLWYFTQAVADGLKLPRLVLRASSISTFVVLTSMPFLRERGYLSVRDSKAEQQVPEFPQIKFKDIPMVEAHDVDGLLQFTTVVYEQSKASSGFIWNSCEDLEQDSLTKCSLQCSIPNFVIGPFHKYFPATSSSLLPQDQTCISWLDKQASNSVIYVSFGSVTALNDTDFLEVAWGLANSNQPFLWVVRPGLVRGSEWLEPLPKGFLDMVEGRGHIVKWAPQQEVLAHTSTGGFWTHCGWNSTLESLCEGVPMICQPSFGDQKLNARYISHVWKVGVHLEYKIERGEIEKAIRKLMVETEGQEMRDRIMCLKEKINLCLKPGGSSYKSLDNLVSYLLSF